MSKLGVIFAQCQWQVTRIVLITLNFVQKKKTKNKLSSSEPARHVKVQIKAILYTSLKPKPGDLGQALSKSHATNGIKLILFIQGISCAALNLKDWGGKKN